MVGGMIVVFPTRGGLFARWLWLLAIALAILPVPAAEGPSPTVPLLVQNQAAPASSGAAAADSVVKIVLYFLHERLWNHIPFGRPKPPEYEI